MGGEEGGEDRTRITAAMSVLRGVRVQVSLGLLGDGEGVLVFVFGGHGWR